VRALPDGTRDTFARERQDQIAKVIEREGRVRVSDMVSTFGVSAVTIRRDLLTLENERRAVRTHGGAIAIDRGRPEVAFDVRERLQAAEKERIGALAASLVRDGESIAMDASTTCLQVARSLRDGRGWTHLTIITNGLRLASEMAGLPGVSVLMLGGRVRWEALSVVGQLGEGIFSRVNVQTAFVGAAGFTLEAGLTDATEEEAQIKRAMVGAARDVVAVVDHSKWGRTSFATFCRADQVGTFVTDGQAPDQLIARLNELGVRVLRAGIEHDERREPA
jgi:DeoR family transcriptional regulator of aga operon/DeoR family fructose operon transcriptional repressor